MPPPPQSRRLDPDLEPLVAGAGLPVSGPSTAADAAADASPEPIGATRGLSARMASVLVSHGVVDVYSAIVPPILALLEIRCRLESWQTALLIGLGSVSSGVSQPIAAWLSDRWDTRIFGPVGLLLAATCLCSIGAATSFATLAALFVVGMIGVGIYHPVGAAMAGHLAERIHDHGRARGVSIFFVCGMIGGTAGAYASPWLAARPGGFGLLTLLMIPGLLLAALLHRSVGDEPHRHHEHRTIRLEPRDRTARWLAMVVLYVANAMRFTVNMALLYLFLRWSEAKVAAAHPGLGVEALAREAALLNGRLIAMMVVGMGLGGLLAGSLIPAGRERWPMVLVPIALAPAILGFNVVGTDVAPLLAVLAGIGFASMIPVSLAIGQRLLPHRTVLASGLLLGGAWACAIAGPTGAERILQRTDLGLEGAFAVFSGVLAAAGLLCLVLRPGLLRRTAVRRAAAA